MGHLNSIRVGWENERLAEFLLSRISFVATPAKTSDDVGTDFISTLFRKQVVTGGKKKKRWEELFPTHSLAIQVKTGKPSTVDVSKHLEYLRSLEIPFFLGFVEQDAGTLTIYSCHHLPALFSGVGDKLRELTLAPCDELDRDKVYESLSSSAANPSGPAQLRAHKVAVLSVSEDTAARQMAAERISEQCSRTQRDIAAKISNQYVFMLDNEIYYTTAGIGSLQSFRSNLANRLMEAFNNLDWALKHGADEKLVQSEFEIYRPMYEGGMRLGIPEFSIAKEAFDRLSRSVT